MIDIDNKIIIIVLLSIALICSIGYNVIQYNKATQSTTTIQNLCTLNNMNANVTNLCLSKLTVLTEMPFSPVPFINCEMESITTP